MSKSSPIVIIEDDNEEKDFYIEVFKKLGVQNKLLFFENGREALTYLETTKDNPFLIICDLKMPVMDGLVLRERIYNNPYLRKKATPFVFRTGSANNENLRRAYELTVQGFFQKNHDYEKDEKQIKIIFDYWLDGLDPNHEL